MVLCLDLLLFHHNPWDLIKLPTIPTLITLKKSESAHLMKSNIDLVCLCIEVMWAAIQIFLIKGCERGIFSWVSWREIMTYIRSIMIRNSTKWKDTESDTECRDSWARTRWFDGCGLILLSKWCESNLMLMMAFIQMNTVPLEIPPMIELNPICVHPCCGIVWGVTRAIPSSKILQQRGECIYSNEFRFDALWSMEFLTRIFECFSSVGLTQKKPVSCRRLPSISSISNCK